MNKSICLYLHVHQPYRVKKFSIFDNGHEHDIFDGVTRNDDSHATNQHIFRKVAEKSYLPTNKVLLDLLTKHDHFKVSLSISGTAIEQMHAWGPDVLESFQKIIDTGKVELVGETYYHSLAFFYDRNEFENQVMIHADMLKRTFGVDTITAFRNTELAYNNELAKWADEAGYKAIIAEGWEPVLGHRSPNYVYRPAYTDNIKLLLKNYKLSDDVAFRFSDSNWQEWPLTTEKFTHWINSSYHGEIFNLFMDYETFGEHQWEDHGIFDFLSHLPEEFLANGSNKFVTLTEAAETLEAKDYVDIHNTLTWADTERDLSAWLGNAMQHQSIAAVYALKDRVYRSQNYELITMWRKLQTSDHFYYMCTKWFNDGDVHAYFSPYESPYEAHLTYMNVIRELDLKLRRLDI